MAGVIFNMPGLRSVECTESSYVLFKNTTECNVSVFWVDYQGQQTYYRTLGPHGALKISTFRSHPWVFRNHKTGELMQVAHQYIFWPEPYKARDPNNPQRWIQCRKEVPIHLPVRTLYETCLLKVIAEFLRKMKSSLIPKVIDGLHLPRILKFELNILLRSIKLHQSRA